jgi:hypothetical protein
MPVYGPKPLKTRIPHGILPYRIQTKSEKLGFGYMAMSVSNFL